MVYDVKTVLSYLSIYLSIYPIYLYTNCECLYRAGRYRGGPGGRGQAPTLREPQQTNQVILYLSIFILFISLSVFLSIYLFMFICVTHCEDINFYLSIYLYNV